MMAGRTIGEAFVAIRPDVSRTGADVKRGLSSQMSKAGKEQGREAGESYSKQFAATVKNKLASGLALAGIGAGIGASLTSGLTSALNVGGANDKLRAQLNLTKEQSGRLGKAAGQLYASNYGASMGEVNDAIASVVRAVPSLRNASVPVLKQIAGGASDIVRVFDQDLAGVSSAVSSLLRSGLAPNAQYALDIITKGLQSGADKGGDFLDTLTEYSVQFKKLGLDAPSSLGIINQLLAGGARNSDLAADAIKEFSIRAVDGSALTAQGFTSLGLDAKRLSAEIGKGGPAAKAAFSTVVERLNAMENPVKRNIAGVALFGTQWEDLGDAFRHLDVSAATDGLGKVAGATSGIADQSDLGRIQTFGRQVQSTFVQVVGGQVLPKLVEWGTRLRDNRPLMDGLREAGGKLLTVLKGTGVVIATVVGWFRQHEAAAKALAVVIGVLVASTAAHSALLAVQAAGGLVAYLKGIRVVAAATKVWAAVQWLLNAALTANPIGIVIVAVAALVAGLIYAYRHSETFRNVVQAAFRVVGAVALWLWHNVIQPAWQGISAAVKIAWVVIQVIFKLWVLYFRTVLFPVIRFLWNNVIKPVFKGVGDTISFAWNKVIKPVLSALGSFISKTVAPAFAKGVEAIRTAWNKVRDAARTPVDFVVNRIINPLIGGFNKVAGALGVKDRIPLISLGGGVPSQGSARLSALARRRGGDGEGVGDGPGDLLGFLRGPARWISDKAGLGRIRGAFGDTMLTRVLTGAGGKAVGWLKDRALSLFQGSEFAGGGAGVGGLAPGIFGVLAALRQAFGNVPVISGLRRGAVTLTGNRSYHALGRAVDIAPVYAWAAYLNGVFGSRLRELITPWQQFNVLNGRRHTYTGVVWNQHNFAGGNAHIHAAMDNGGYLMPGWNPPIYNGTGKPEPVIPADRLGGNTYNINVNVPVGAHPAEVGRTIITHIQAFEQANGRRWRTP